METRFRDFKYINLKNPVLVLKPQFQLGQQAFPLAYVEIDPEIISTH